MKQEDFISMGIAASQANDSERALKFFEQAAREQPQSGIPHFLIASELASLGNMDAAEAAFANVVLLSPEFSVARYQLGLLQFSSGRAPTGILTWEPLLALPEDDALPHFVKGFIALAQDHFEQCKEHFYKGMTLNTTNAPMNADIAKVIAEIDALPSKTANVPPEQRAEEDLNHQEGTHVLLSNYLH